MYSRCTPSELNSRMLDSQAPAVELLLFKAAPAAAATPAALTAELPCRAWLRSWLNNTLPKLCIAFVVICPFKLLCVEVCWRSEQLTAKARLPNVFLIDQTTEYIPRVAVVPSHVPLSVLPVGDVWCVTAHDMTASSSCM